jgi:MraZ protein
MFDGRFSNTLDDKGRVAIPVRYREALSASGQDRIVVTRFKISGVPCLEAYDAHAWQELVSSVQSKAGAFGMSRAMFESVYIGEAQVCQPDKQGRILIPPALRSHAALTEEVVFVGVGRKFQIFDPAQREKLTDQFFAELGENPDMLHDVG